MLLSDNYRYNYEGMFLDAEELKDFLELEQYVSSDKTQQSPNIPAHCMTDSIYLIQLNDCTRSRTKQFCMVYRLLGKCL